MGISEREFGARRALVLRDLRLAGDDEDAISNAMERHTRDLSIADAREVVKAASLDCLRLAIRDVKLRRGD